MARHARVLDRRRFEFLLGATDADAVLAAVDGYRNADGGYGWGLEPDLRAPESQPGGALHALEVFAEVAPVTTPRAVQVCDWLASVTLADGGLPFALPVADPAGCAPFWAEADPAVSALQSTAFALATALRVAEHDRAVAAHPWLERATEYCIDAVSAIDGSVHAIALCFAVHVLDAAHDRHPDAPGLLERLGAFIPDSGLVPVAGGAEGEVLRPLDFAPTPGRPARELFRTETIVGELQRLADTQHDDGGWSVDFNSYSPAAALEWRGYKTVGTISILNSNAIL